MLLDLSCTLIKEVVDVNVNSGHEHEILKVTSIVINISAVSATINNWVTDLVISLVHVKESPKLLTKDTTMAALRSEHEWVILFILKCIVHQQTAKLQNSLQNAERMAYLLRSRLWHREVYDLLPRKTLGDHGIDKLFPPSNQFPGTP